MSDHGRISPQDLSLQYQADNWEQRKVSIRGSLIDPIPNSPN